jgi:hypothetical protein
MQLENAQTVTDRAALKPSLASIQPERELVDSPADRATSKLSLVSIQLERANNVLGQPTPSVEFPTDRAASRLSLASMQPERSKSILGRPTPPVDFPTAHAVSVSHAPRPHSVAGGKIEQSRVRQDASTAADKQTSLDLGDAIKRDIDKTTALLRYKGKESSLQFACQLQEYPKLYSYNVPVDIPAGFGQINQDGSVFESIAGAKWTESISNSIRGTKSLQKSTPQEGLRKDTISDQNFRDATSINVVHTGVEMSTAKVADLALSYETDYSWSTLSQLLDTANEISMADLDPKLAPCRYSAVGTPPASKLAPTSGRAFGAGTESLMDKGGKGGVVRSGYTGDSKIAPSRRASKESAAESRSKRETPRLSSLVRSL